MKSKIDKPDVFSFHDYRKFLKEMLKAYKKVNPSFTIKKVAEELKITPSYFSMILNGKRELTVSLVGHLSKVFSLSEAEVSYLELLVNFSSSKGDISRSRLIERMKKYKRYRDLNPDETRLHDYMSNWLNIVIREMSMVEGFSCNPTWIQKQIMFPVSLDDIKKSLVFLEKNNFIKSNDLGNYKKENYQITCTDEIYKNALITFHREFLELAGNSALYAETDERRLLGHCTALSDENIEKAKDIIEKAYNEIRSLQTVNDSAERVYFVELALFPISGRSNE